MCVRTYVRACVHACICVCVHVWSEPNLKSPFGKNAVICGFCRVSQPVQRGTDGQGEWKQLCHTKNSANGMELGWVGPAGGPWLTEHPHKFP